jgi:glutamate synthase (NADH)
MLFRALKGIQLPEFGQYATGIIYMDKDTHVEAEKDFDTLAASLGIKVIGWREVPVDSNAIGVVARKSEPLSRQVFLTADLDKEALKIKVC